MELFQSPFGNDPFALVAKAFKNLYLESVRSDTTPRHIMTVSDSLYLMELSLNGREYEVGAILDNFRLNKRVE